MDVPPTLQAIVLFRRPRCCQRHVCQGQLQPTAAEPPQPAKWGQPKCPKPYDWDADPWRTPPSSPRTPKATHAAQPHANMPDLTRPPRPSWPPQPNPPHTPRRHGAPSKRNRCRMIWHNPPTLPNGQAPCPPPHLIRSCTQRRRRKHTYHPHTDVQPGPAHHKPPRTADTTTTTPLVIADHSRTTNTASQLRRCHLQDRRPTTRGPHHANPAGHPRRPGYDRNTTTITHRGRRRTRLTTGGK